VLSRRRPKWPCVTCWRREQRWQPLGDGHWGRVVGREGAERSVGRCHGVWRGMLYCVCVFITTGPSTICVRGEEGDIGGHVLRETTSRGLCGLVCPSRTSECGGEGDCVKKGGGEEGKRGSVHWSGYDATALDIEVDPQRCRFGSRKSDFTLQAFTSARVNHILLVTNPNTKRATIICPNALSQIGVWGLRFNCGQACCALEITAESQPALKVSFNRPRPSSQPACVCLLL
jgi:hypothetical protein